MYVITGIDRSGKRFTPIYTDTPQHYNIWRGSIWKLGETTINGTVFISYRRKLIKRINN